MASMHMIDITIQLPLQTDCTAAARKNIYAERTYYRGDESEYSDAVGYKDRAHMLLASQWPSRQLHLHRQSFPRIENGCTCSGGCKAKEHTHKSCNLADD